MVSTYINGSVAGDAATQDHTFLIVAGERHLGLPQRCIDELDLKISTFAPTGTARDCEGPAGDATYMTRANFCGNSIELDVLPARTPTVGAAALRSMGFSVDLDNGSVMEPETPLTIHRGFSPWAQPAGYNRVYASSSDGLVYALDAGSLEIVWRNQSLAGRAIAHFTVASGKVFAALADGWLYAFDAGNLETEWRNNLLEGRAIAHFTVASGKVFAALADGWLYAFDAGNLETEWRNNLLEGRAIAHFTVASGKVFAALSDGRLYAFDAGNLETEWRSDLLAGRAITQFTVANDRIFIATDDGEVYALDAGNLELRHQTALPGSGKVAHLAAVPG